MFNMFPLHNTPFPMERGKIRKQYYYLAPLRKKEWTVSTREIF
jgi:hypothetical protein